jgi:hypothetical protein
MKRRIRSLMTLRGNHGAIVASKICNEMSMLAPAETVVVNNPSMNGMNPKKKKKLALRDLDNSTYLESKGADLPCTERKE